MIFIVVWIDQDRIEYDITFGIKSGVFYGQGKAPELNGVVPFLFGIIRSADIGKDIPVPVMIFIRVGGGGLRSFGLGHPLRVSVELPGTIFFLAIVMVKCFLQQ